MIGWRAKPSTTEEDKPKGFDDFELRLGDLMRGERATLGKSLLDVQRELKIKATYIAAIENADLSAFETPGFVAGYVRSYARYLAMDPEWAFERFCAEAGYSVSHGLSAAAAPQQIAKARARRDVADPLADPNASFIPRGEAIWSRIEPGAVGSIAVLVALIGAIGYGGWSVLQEVQRVQLAPVDQAPTVVAQIDPLSEAGTAAPQMVASRPTEPAAQAVASAEGAAARDVMDRLYRPQALDVPVLTSRDGPIAAINPRQTGVLSEVAAADVVDAAIDEALGSDVQVIAEAKQGIEVLAVRPSWVRVNAADGTVLFEKILDAGERYVVPPLETAAVFRTGNSGSIYFLVDGVPYGPAAPGANVAKDIKLSPEALTQTYARADLSKDQDLANFATADATPVLQAPTVSE
ncbi:helix-turn-helix domain-containing protein [Tabrizicola flagellatus]|uniref:helix-turn-helix domain-containing protein n=1 Tax=Tabrizicola flagellatus TaxID=2593021 RepID=UPI0011F1FCEA|nr:helix-turn-helix domain-containing protein [Tabrizicola flagellatus]